MLAPSKPRSAKSLVASTTISSLRSFCRLRAAGGELDARPELVALTLAVTSPPRDRGAASMSGLIGFRLRGSQRSSATCSPKIFSRPASTSSPTSTR